VKVGFSGRAVISLMYVHPDSARMSAKMIVRIKMYEKVFLSIEEENAADVVYLHPPVDSWQRRNS
jgi:hypothetical protein